MYLLSFFTLNVGTFLLDEKPNSWSPQWPSQLQLDDACCVALPDAATSKHVQPAPGPEVLVGQARLFSAAAIFSPCEPGFSIYPATHPHQVRFLSVCRKPITSTHVKEKANHLQIHVSSVICILKCTKLNIPPPAKRKHRISIGFNLCFTRTSIMLLKSIDKPSSS